MLLPCSVEGVCSVGARCGMSWLFLVLCSVQEAREAHHLPADIHEVAPNETETETAGDPQGKGVWL